MKLLLIRESNTIYRYSNTSYGLTLIGTIAKSVATVRILDNNAIRKEYSNQEIIQEIQKFNPDVIGFNIHSYNILATRKLITQIRRQLPGICLIAGGLHTFSAPDEVADSHVDIVVKGEGDAVIVPLLNILKPYVVGHETRPFVLSEPLSRELQAIKGLIFQPPGQPRVDTGWPDLFTDFDSLPFVDYTLCNLQDFIRAKEDEQFVTNVLITQRGCPYQCTFCQLPLKSMIKVREHSTEYRLDYYEYLIKRHHLKHIVFYDNNFTINKHRTLEFCQGIIKRGLHKQVSFSCQTNVVLPLDDDLLTTMRQAGCNEIALGVERMSEDSLGRIKKNKNHARILENINQINKNNIDVVVNCLIGLPFDTADIVNQENELFKSIIGKVKACSINTTLPPPGTEIYNHTPYKQWYLDEKIMGWRPSFYHLAYGYTNNAYDVNYFNLDADTQRAIKLFKEQFYDLTLQQMNSRLINAIHFLEKQLAIPSYALFRISPKWEHWLFYLPKVVRSNLHNYFRANFYVWRNRTENKEDCTI
ncbi:MAG: radical SAM protein [Magnetococcales bacterium]|nr:radical SAM protein [Magnetococcales bacterium]